MYFNGGLNYIWGVEVVMVPSFDYQRDIFLPNIKRSDFGFNLRAGVEYSPLKWLTLYTDFDFLGIFYLRKPNPKDYPAEIPLTKAYLEKKYGISYLPSRWDLSWHFGIGFNFGK